MSTDDEICWYCHTNKGVLLACKGNCHKYYHTECLNIDTPEYIGKWLCPDCYNQKHKCSKCGVYKSDDELILCNYSNCGRYYCQEKACLGINPLAAINSYICACHTCAKCESDTNEPNNHFVYCVSCPKGYHEKCLPEDIISKNPKYFECLEHSMAVKRHFGIDSNDDKIDNGGNDLFSIKQDMFYQVPTKRDLDLLDDSNSSSSDNELMESSDDDDKPNSQSDTQTHQNQPKQVKNENKQPRAERVQYQSQYDEYGVPDLSKLNQVEKNKVLYDLVASQLDDQLQINQRMLEKLRNQEFHDDLFNFQ